MNPTTLLVLGLIIWLTTGCTTVKTEHVPVWTPPTLPTIPHCDLKTRSIDDTTSAGHIAQAYVHDLTCLKSTDGQLRDVLESVK